MLGLISKAEATIKKFRLLDRGDAVLIALSGGPDSVCLFYVLHLLKKKFSLTLHVAHLDHMLRSEESTADAEFVKSLAEKFNYPLQLGRVDIPALIKREKKSSEEVARQARYKFLFDSAKALGIKKIAVGHNQNDQAETILMRIIRGTGIYGLSGIVPLRKIKDYTVVRPLLEIRRAEIEKFLKQHKLEFRTDSSNLKQAYFRNRVRRRLIPLLAKDFNSNIEDILVNLGENARVDYEYLKKNAGRKFRRISKITDSSVTIDCRAFLKLHPALQRMVLRRASEEMKGDLRRLTYQHFCEMNALIKQRPGNSIVDLPGGLSLKKLQNKLVFYLRRA